MLEIKDASVSYGNVQVLWDINISVGTKEVVALIGANAAGKTTLIRAISGLVRLKRGALSFMGKNLGDLRPAERVRVGVIQVPEGRKLFPAMSVHENLKMGAYPLADKREIEANMEYVYGLFPELMPLRKQLAGTLSGGQQQMVAIARALTGSPKLLLVDEFSLGLAPVVVDRLAEAIRTISETKDIAILMVEQDVQLGLELSSRGYVLETGRVVMSGPSKELMQNPVIRSAYLGL